MEIQKCHFLWPCSLTWLGFRPWTKGRIWQWGQCCSPYRVWEFSNQMELRYLMLKIIKGNPFYKNHSNQRNSKGLHTILVPFGYVDQDIKTLLFHLINIPRQWNEYFEQPSLLYQRVCNMKLVAEQPNCSVTCHAARFFITFIYPIFILVEILKK